MSIRCFISCEVSPHRAPETVDVEAIVAGVYQAYSIAVGSVFQIGMVTTIAALLVVFVMRELPLRTTMGHGPSATPAGSSADPAEPGAPDRPVPSIN